MGTAWQARASGLSVLTDQPEHVGATAQPPVSGSYATAARDRPGRCPRSSHRLTIAKPISLRRLDLVSEGIRDAVLFLCSTSSLMLRRRVWDTAPWDGFGLGRREQYPQATRPGSGPEAFGHASYPAPSGGKDQFPASGRVSSAGRDQLPIAELCPAGEGLRHPYHRIAQREKDLNTPTRWTEPGTESYVKSAWSGPRCLRRAYVKSAAAAFPLGDFGESESSLRSDPGSRETPPAFYGGKRWKSQITIQWSHTPSPLHSPLQHPTGKVLPIVDES